METSGADAVPNSYSKIVLLKQYKMIYTAELFIKPLQPYRLKRLFKVSNVFRQSDYTAVTILYNEGVRKAFIGQKGTY